MGNGGKKNKRMLLYHYTSLSELPSIITNDGIKLWATRYDKLNDPNELVFMRNYILPHIAKKNGMDLQEFKDLYENFPHVLSLCEVPDSVHMWENYADNGRGVLLGLSYDALLAESKNNQKGAKEEEEDFLFKIRYCKDDERLSTFTNLLEDLDIDFEFCALHIKGNSFYTEIVANRGNRCDTQPFEFRLIL